MKDAVNEDIDKFRGEMEELIGEVEGLVGKIADLVTSVELVKSYAIDQESGFAPIMLSTAIEQENVFSEGISNKITFTKMLKFKLRDNSWFVFLLPTLF